MKSLRSLLFALLAAGAVAACTNPGHDDAGGSHAHPPTATTTAPVSPQPKAHGSHDPAHGGLVMMDAKYHVEIVLDPKAGQHRVYVSDDVRTVLPASTFDEVKLTVAGEKLAMSRSVDDTAWQAAGRAAPTTGVKVSIAYSKGGQQVARFDDLPIEYVLTGKMPEPPKALEEPQAKQDQPAPHGEPGHHH